MSEDQIEESKAIVTYAAAVVSFYDGPQVSFSLPEGTPDGQRYRAILVPIDEFPACCYPEGFYQGID